MFPWLRGLGGNGSTYAGHVNDARFTIPNAGLLAKAVDGIDLVPMDDRDTKGDVYEYMLSQIATAGRNGQFRTPRHIIQLMVEMTAPAPTDVICDPASGTCGFLVAAGEYLRENHRDALLDSAAKEAFAGFLDDTTYSASQIEFVNLIIDDLSQHGVIEARRFYESPYTDLAPRGPDDLFSRTDLDRLIDTLAAVRAQADVA